MSGRGLNSNLLEGGDFSSISQDVQVNLNDIEYNQESIDNIADSIKNDDKVNDRLLGQYKSSMRKMDNLIPQTEHLLDNLTNVCYTQKQQNIAKKLQDAFDKKRENFENQKQELEYLVKDKNLERRIKNIPDSNLQGSMMDSFDS
jgi:exonuclease VII large subunit